MCGHMHSFSGDVRRAQTLFCSLSVCTTGKLVRAHKLENSTKFSGDLSFSPSHTIKIVLFPKIDLQFIPSIVTAADVSFDKINKIFE